MRSTIVRLGLIGILGLSCLGLSACSESDIEELLSEESTVIPVATRIPVPTRAPIPNPAPRSGDSWLIMVYSDADDEVLERDMMFDINEIETVGSTDAVQIVAQIDRFDGGYSGDKNWKRTRRYFITQDDNLERINSDMVADLGEVNMADGQSLTDFATWAITTYPADHYVLIMSDHGMGWPGGWSDPDPAVPGPDGLELTSGGDLLLLNEIAQSLADVRANTGIAAFDVIGFDACLMGHLEVAAAMAPHARVMVASQEVEPAMGWAYAAFIRELNQRTNMSAVELGNTIVDGYIVDDLRIQDDDARAKLVAENFSSDGPLSADVVAESFSSDITLSSYNLQELPTMLSAFDDFVVALSEMEQTTIAEARTYSQSFENIFDENYDSPYIDLGHFASVIAADLPADDPHQATIVALLQANSRVVTNHRNGADRPGASGFSVYFPVSEIFTSSYAGPDVYTTVSDTFSAETRWDDFLAFHYSGMPLGDKPEIEQFTVAPGAAEITVSDIQLSQSTINVAGASTLSASVSGSQIGFVYSFTGYYDPEADTILVVDRDYIDAGVTRTVDGVDYPDWQGELVDIEFDWEPILYGIDDGSESLVFALLDPQDYGKADEAATYTVEGVYTFASGKTRDARLFFKEGELVKVLGFDGTKTIGAPSVITPQSGDSFTIWHLKIALYSDDASKDVEYYYEEGETLNFTGKPWAVYEYQANTGDYVVGIQADDMAGNRYENYTVLTVEE